MVLLSLGVLLLCSCGSATCNIQLPLLYVLTLVSVNIHIYIAWVYYRYILQSYTICHIIIVIVHCHTSFKYIVIFKCIIYYYIAIPLSYSCWCRIHWHTVQLFYILPNLTSLYIFQTCHKFVWTFKLNHIFLNTLKHFK